MITKEKPQFKHDCDKCTFIKRGVWLEREVDFYVCGDGDTTVFRHGDEPHENGAMQFQDNVEHNIEVWGEHIEILKQYKEMKKN